MTIKVREVQRALEEPVGERIPNTVDGLLTGDPDADVTGIATAFMPTYRVIRQAAELGANLLIAHEGVYFSHRPVEGLSGHDPVVQGKRRLIEESGIAIYRLHDHIHRYRPDGVMEGLIRTLGWESHAVRHLPVSSVVDIPPAPLQAVVEHVKRKLNLAHVRVVGDLAVTCKRVGIAAGYRGGGATAIPLFAEEGAELVIAGEGPEWETPEYVRDALSQGYGKAMLLLGHAESEEPGMKLLAERLRMRFPDVPVHFCPENALFRSV